MKKIHLVCSPELVMLIKRSLEHEGYFISGSHSTLHAFTEGIHSKEVDSSATIIMEGGAGLSIPIHSEDIVAWMEHIRKLLKSSRLIVQLEPALQDDVEFIRSMVNLGIHDLQFASSFRSEDIMNWIKEKKTTRDYYNVLGKQKKGFPFGRKDKGQIKAEGDKEPVSTPTVQIESLARPEPGAKPPTASPSLPTHATRSSGAAATSAGKTAASKGTSAGMTTSSPLRQPIDRPLVATVEEPHPPVQAIQAPKVVTSGQHLPLIIGFCGVGGEEDVGAAAFLIAAGLADLGYKPLVCGDNRPEISSLEQVAFDGEKDDPTANMFEYEGVTFYRRGRTWDISELMTSHFTHILLWVDIHQERSGTSGLELWWNSQVPIMVGNGAMWKYELLKEKLNTLNPYERKRCRLLLENGQQEVLNKLRKDFSDVHATLMPAIQDPLYPDKQAVEWVMQLLAVDKKLLRKPVIIWGIIGAAIFLTLILIAVGIAIVPEHGG